MHRKRKKQLLSLSLLTGERKQRATGKKKKKYSETKNEKKKNTPPPPFLSLLSLPLQNLKTPPENSKPKTPKTLFYSLNPSAESCTPFIALPLISCVPAQLGSHPTASGVEHAIDRPLGTVASADLDG